LTAEVRTFCGRAPATDDVTMLIVQYDGEPGAGKAGRAGKAGGG
jgi:hypothetical protein